MLVVIVATLSSSDQPLNTHVNLFVKVTSKKIIQCWDSGSMITVKSLVNKICPLGISIDCLRIFILQLKWSLWNEWLFRRAMQQNLILITGSLIWYQWYLQLKFHEFIIMMQNMSCCQSQYFSTIEMSYGNSILLLNVNAFQVNLLISFANFGSLQWSLRMVLHPFHCAFASGGSP